MSRDHLSTTDNKYRMHDMSADVTSQKVSQNMSRTKANKVFNDPIHGHIEMNSACMAIIDTPEFQRLRFVKQLGLVYFVFPGASHNRFEHCLGTCHLSGQFVRMLKENQPCLGISDTDVLCVELAGLCHDLGHGPLSHLFDEKFIPVSSKQSKWKHEDASVAMFEHILQKHTFMGPDGMLRNDYSLSEVDIVFIKEMIQGLSFSNSGEWICQGRGKEKAYLYEIVSNKRNSIDVDKFDYFARDCHHLGIKTNFDHTRFMKFARVCEVNGQMQICIRDKEVANLYNMFYTRWTLHKYAYQHRVKSIIETMVLDAMLKAEKHLKFRGTNGVQLKLSECIHDMEAYTKLSDDVINMILHSQNEEKEMVEARDIIRKIYHRNLYKCVYETRPLKPETLQLTENEIKDRILGLAESKKPVDSESIRVHITYLDFGMKNQNPLEKLNVYSKKNFEAARPLSKDEASRILGPTIFSEIIVRIIYCNDLQKEKDETVESIFSAAKEWEDGLLEEAVPMAPTVTAVLTVPTASLNENIASRSSTQLNILKETCTQENLVNGHLGQQNFEISNI